MNKLRIGMIVFLVVCSTISGIFGLPEEFCDLRAQGIHAHPTECSEFVICTHTGAIVQGCTQGMLFDSQISACNFAHSTSCHKNIQPDSENIASEIQKPNRLEDEEYTYKYSPNDMDIVHEPHIEKSNNENDEQKYSKEGHEDRFYDGKDSNNYDFYDQDAESPRHESPRPYAKEGIDHQTRPYDAENYGTQTRQSYEVDDPRNKQTYSSGENSEPYHHSNIEDIRGEPVNYKDDNRRYPNYEEDYDERRYHNYIEDEKRRNSPTDYNPDYDGKQYNERFDDSREIDPVPNAEPGVDDIEKSSMHHHVHADTSDAYIFKRIRGSNEMYFYEPMENRPTGTDCYAHNGLLADENDCTRYIQCANGRPFIKHCPRGTYYTPAAKTCTFDNAFCNDAYKSGREPYYYSNDDDMLEDIHEFMKTNLIEAKVNALTILRREAYAARQMQDGESRPFTAVASFLGSTTYVRQLSMPAFLQLECLRMIKQKFRLTKDEMEEIMDGIGSALPINPFKVAPDMQYPVPTMSACPYPKNDENNHCDPYAPYRTFDGSCNNLRRPLWGKSFRALTRFVQPDYCDGIGELRCARSGRNLPSARAISASMFGPDVTRTSPIYTMMHMTFGQFLAHDNERTAVTKLSKDDDGTGELVDVMCGEDGCSTRGPENRACVPIPIPSRDPDFTNKSCLMFVRTQEVMRDDCRLAPREQLNQLTAWFDASVIYGSTKNESDALRDLTNTDRGRLKTIRHPYDNKFKDLLPQTDNKDCRDLNSTIRCFTAGDKRVNEQIGLIAIHTIFHREHNRIEEELHALNPHWSGERLYQETRKIMTAVWQYIVYNEYVPLVLGPEYTRRFGLQLGKHGYWDGYDDRINGDIANSFATAAFRFGHSQVGDFIHLKGQMYSQAKKLHFSTVLRRPLTVYETSLPAGSAVDSIILGTIAAKAERVDTHFTKELTVRLFSENPPTEPGLDLPSINIHRGRDHGIPSYNSWRQWCGLPVAEDFHDMVDVPYDIRGKFSRLYESVNDVDLYPAGVVEEHVPGGMVGPTFACIIGHQFRNLKVGDRYWHETSNRNIGFTTGQLDEIRKSTFARMICDNCDWIDSIQKYVMLQPISEAFRNLGTNNYREVYSLASLYRGEDNERQPCSNLPQLDLSMWRERIL